MKQCKWIMMNCLVTMAILINDFLFWPIYQHSLILQNTSLLDEAYVDVLFGLESQLIYEVSSGLLYSAWTLYHLYKSWWDDELSKK